MEAASAHDPFRRSAPDIAPRLDRRMALWSVLFTALAIRLYLGLTSFCISGDGAAYLGMAREFAAGAWQKAIGAVFSPLYPLLVAQAHRLIADWEIAGALVSVVMGTAAVGAIYLFFREVFGREIALGAAALAAIHPDMAAYSGSVRTEAGYVCLLMAASWMLLRGVNRRQAGAIAAAGALGGLAYLYRTEGIGFLILGLAFIAATAALWKMTAWRFAIASAAAFSAAFLALALPYIISLRLIGGHWTIGREFTAAMMYGMGDIAAKNSDHWRSLGYSAAASPLAPILSHPGLYLLKVRSDFVASLRAFVQAMGPLLTVLMIGGLWTRGRRLLEPPEVLPASLIAFYFCGFSLSYTGARFMTHLIPFAFGWTAIGAVGVIRTLERMAARAGWNLPHSLVPAAIALALLPRTLWPIGYDMRGVRYAGERIARLSGGRGAVAARDGRVAFYARTRFVELPTRNVGDMCAWLQGRDAVGYLVIDNHDERRFGVSPGSPCLEFLRRYPRYGSGYYDLYSVRRPEAAAYGDSR